MRIAYLTTQYPTVSHTFIRRELTELENRGHHIVRLSIRAAPPDLCDPLDLDEAAQVMACLDQRVGKLLRACLQVALSTPGRFVSALRFTVNLSRRSERGLIRHLAYLVEAAYLLRIIRRERIEHVHVHFGSNAATVARLIRRLGGPPYSMAIHGPGDFDAPLGFDLRGKIKEADFVTAISHYCRAQLYRWADPADWGKIHIVRCTIGNMHSRGPVSVPRDSRTLVSVGRISAQKGQSLLLDAVRRLRDEGLDMRLAVVGDGELRPWLENRIRELDLQGIVDITGYVGGNEVRRRLEASRALVLPSFAEGLPVVIMEALAAGRPVIASSIAGIPELVQHGVSGWLVPAGDVDALVNAMRTVLTLAPSELSSMGLKGREAVLREHGVEKQVDVLEALLASGRQRSDSSDESDGQ